VKLARALLAVAALALLAGLLVWRLGSSAPPPEATLAGTAPGTAAEVPADETPVQEAMPAEPAREEVPPAAAEAPALSPADATPRDEILLRGRVIVADQDGRELTDASGSFVLGVFRRRATGRAEEVAFVDGEFEHAIEDVDSLDGVSVESLSVGDRPALVEEPTGRITPDLDAQLVVRARLSPPSILRVVDAQSGADLHGVALVRCAGFPLDRLEHPGVESADRTVARDLQSPIDVGEHAAALFAFPGQTRMLVGAEGYAWRLTEVDRQRGGERVVALERGADLTVSVRGVDPDVQARLRLRAEERPIPVAEVTLERDGEVELHGLSPELLRAVAEVGEWFRDPLVLGEASVELRAGELTRIDLLLDAPPVFETAPAAGTVHVAREWRARRAMVVLELLDTPLNGFPDHLTFQASQAPSTRTGYDAFRWESNGLQVGRYELELHEPPFSIVVEVPPGGRDDLDLVLPPPVELTVHVVNDETGRDVDTDQLHWAPRRPEGVLGGGLEQARRAPDGRGYRIRAPAVEVDLHMWAWEYQPCSETVDLGRGVREHTLRLKPGCGLTLRMLDGETPVGFPPDWGGKPESVDGDGKPSLMQQGDFERKFMVTQPGTYSIQPPTVPGYLPPPAQTIEVFPGEFTAVVVALEREH